VPCETGSEVYGLIVPARARGRPRCVHGLVSARVLGHDDLVHLLIAGIPARGKSTFARWLVNNHDFVRCPSGEEPDASFYAEIDRARSARPNVVIDWGFPLHALPRVREYITSGFEAWWFDADRDSALERFLARPNHPGTRADWDRQLTAIEAHWDEIAAVFRDRILDFRFVRPHRRCGRDMLRAHPRVTTAGPNAQPEI
jgi:hypothetical protein